LGKQIRIVLAWVGVAVAPVHAVRSADGDHPSFHEMSELRGEIRRSHNIADRVAQVGHWWAEAMVEQVWGSAYREQWATDPIVSQLTPAQEPSFQDQMIGLAVETVQKRLKR
jgi:hypothetical protein